MGIIQTLDPHLANMIAAGEVVERPVGIIKELVENSIDAQATQITIALWQGGIEKIKISDNGYGMDAFDALLAFERHATSKIKDEQDLWRIQTMGFRGEALPSIASVAHVLLQTSNGKEGSEVEIAWGQVLHQKPVARNQGTTIEVSQLFQKTPARLKHLKSANYEYSLIFDVIQKFALAHPEIRFVVEHNDKVTFESKGKPDLLTSIFDVYGLEIAKNSIEIKAKDDDYELYGYIAQPSINRANKYYIVIFINGRMIRNQKLTKAICDAYGPYLPQGRFPIAILHIKMDYQLVDVNVHPSKWEIRLSKGKQLEELIEQTIKQALLQQYETTTIRKVQASMNRTTIEQTSMKEALDVSERQQRVTISQEIPVYVMPEQKALIEVTNKEESQIIEEIKQEVSEQITDDQEQPKQQIEEKIEREVRIHPNFPHLQIIGQFANKYVLAEGEKGLYLIDQHAAHERINYEVLSKQFIEANFHSKLLLVPYHLKVDHGVIAQLEQINQKAATIGLHFEEFGMESLIVREIPGWMEGSDEFALVTDLMEYLKNQKNIDLLQIRKKAIETKACHQSIRFHRPLQMIEMIELVKQLEVCEQPFHCPHGRPTFIMLDHKTLEKEFLRGG